MTVWHDMWPEISVLIFLLAWAAVITGLCSPNSKKTGRMSAAACVSKEL